MAPTAPSTTVSVVDLGTIHTEKPASAIAVSELVKQIGNSTAVTTGTATVNTNTTGMTDTTMVGNTMTSTDTATTTTVTTDTAVATGTMTDMASDVTILTTLEGLGNYSTFLQLVRDAELEDVLVSDEYTILVPTDEAFAALDPEVRAMLAENPDLLAAVLGYHVIPGKIMAADLAGATLINVYDEELPLVVSDKGITIGSATVNTTAIQAGNSVVYPINSVLIPDGLE
ncbi:fasciclin domain-containing protein [Deinococcus lacus]|uniref:Fasciclin domain-containing protein n=1 Tax=Deinococcus lacus TaxID=392561 RepID=A0ABW1YB57_9DEIO